MTYHRILLALLTAMALPAAGWSKAPEIDARLLAAEETVTPAKMRADDAMLVGFGTRNVFSEATGGKRGISAARDWLREQFEQIAADSNGRMSVSVDKWVQKADGKRIVRDVELANVLAVLKGSEDSTRTYVISSHYDSRNSTNEDAEHDAPGADDNASGVVVVLAAARALAKLPTRATIIFAAYSSEEQGLFGSLHHAQALKEAGIDVEGDVNDDIVGASVGPKGERNPDRLRIFSEAIPAGGDLAKITMAGAENDSASRELARFAKEIGDEAVPNMRGELIYRTDRYLRGGDHMSFNKVGFPAIRLVEPVENFDHQHQDVRKENGVQYGDLMEYMDFDYLARVARYNIAVIGALALAPPPPKDPVIVARELTNETELKWSPSPGAARYEIVTRPTEQPRWTGIVDAGNALTARLPLSKDNFLFAVRAVDAEGHRSVSVFPTPSR